MTVKCGCLLAAGMGSRLKKYTANQTKCMVSVAGDRLVDHTLRALIAGGVETIFIVVGFCGDHLTQHVTNTFPNLDVHFIPNSAYASTNNIHSLKLALPELIKFDEIILVESDIWVEQSIAVDFIRDRRENVVLVSPFRYWMDGTCVTMDASSQSITGFVDKADISLFPNDSLFKTVNWYKFSGVFLRDVYAHFINAYVAAFGKNAYYEDVLKVITSVSPSLFSPTIIQEQNWMEIDDEADLSRAELLAAPTKKTAIELVQKFGGFWKYRFIEDLTLLVNPFFPPQGMKNEILEVLKVALWQYPSKLSTITGIVAKSLGCEAEQLVVGNGASELMAVLFAESTTRRFVISPPFFLEYFRLLGDRLTIYQRQFPVTSLETALAGMVQETDLDIILVNPNNPTGELCRMDMVLQHLPTLAAQGRRLILDESFMDFASSDESLFNKRAVNEHPNLFILKSFGKCFGIPGIRLGILASSDTPMMEVVRQRLPLWNISSTAEVFLDLLPRYKREYQESLHNIRKERNHFQKNLTELGIQHYPSEANFVFFRLNEIPGEDFGAFCFKKGLLVKEITGRDGLVGVYYRIAVRTRELNNKVIEILRDTMRHSNTKPWGIDA